MLKNCLLVYTTAVMNPVLLRTNLLPNMTMQNKFRQTVLNWIIHQISRNYNAHYNITYLEHGEIKGHGPASSQSYNAQEAVTKTHLMI